MKHLLVILAILVKCSLLIQAQSEVDVMVNHLKVGEQNTDGANSLIIHQDNVFVLWSDYNANFSTYLSKSTNEGSSFREGHSLHCLE